MIIFLFSPYKISQNLAHLEGTFHEKLKSHRLFRPFDNRFYEEININHTLSWFSQASYMGKKKKTRQYWGSSKVMFKKILQNFVKSSLKFCLISDFSPQLITCMFSQKTGSDISCKLSPVETICMKYQNLLSGKSKKKNISVHVCCLLKILSRMLSVKWVTHALSVNMNTCMKSRAPYNYQPEQLWHQ